MTAANLTNDNAKANEASKVGTFRTARQMALASHNLSRDGMEARTADGALWKWSNHFNVWACVAA